MSKHFKDAPIETPRRPPDDDTPTPVDGDGKPDLGQLIRRWGSRSRIPNEVWERYDAAMAHWHRSRG